MTETTEMNETIEIYVTYETCEKESVNAQFRFKLSDTFIGPLDVDIWFSEHGVNRDDIGYLALDVVTQDRAILGLSGRVDWEYIWDVDPTVLKILIEYSRTPDKLVKALWYHVCVGTPIKDVIHIHLDDVCTIYDSEAKMFREWASDNNVSQEAIEFINVDDVLDNRYDGRDKLGDGRYIILI